MKKLLSLTFLCGLLTAPALHGAAASSNESTDFNAQAQTLAQTFSTQHKNNILRAFQAYDEFRTLNNQRTGAREPDQEQRKAFLGYLNDHQAARAFNAYLSKYGAIDYDSFWQQLQKEHEMLPKTVETAITARASDMPAQVHGIEAKPKHFEPIEGNITLIGRNGTVDLSADAAQRHSGFIRSAIAFNKTSGKNFRNISLPNYDKNLLQLIAKLVTLRSENTSLKKLAQTLAESNVNFNQVLQLADSLNLDETIVKAIESVEGDITLIGRDGRVDLSADAAHRHSGFIRHAITFNKASGKDFRTISLPDYDRNLLQLIAKLITLRSENASLRKLAQTLEESNADFNQILQTADYLNLDNTVIQAIGLAYAPAIVRRYQNQIANLASNATLPEILASEDYELLPNDIKTTIVAFIADAYMKAVNNDISKLPVDLKAYAIQKTNNALLSDKSFLHRINTPQHTFVGRCGWVRSLAFSPDGSQLASAPGNSTNTIKIWNPRNWTKAPVTSTGHKNTVTALAFSPDGSQLASGSGDGTVKIWNPRNWNAQPITFTGETYHISVVFSLAFSPDGKQLASGSNNGTVKIWNPRNWTELPVTLTDHTSTVYSLAFSPDSSQLASGSQDRTLKIWNPRNRTEQPVTLTGTSQVFSLAFSPDGSQLASGSWDGTVNIWNPRNWTEQPVPLTHAGPVDSLAFSPDGSLLASGSLDNTINIWNPHNWTEQPVTLTGTGTAPTLSLAFSPDGSQLASGSDDETVMIWAMPNSIALPYQQFDLTKRAAPAWERNEPFVINNTEDLEIYNELPERYRDERLFTVPVRAASSCEAASSSAAASSSE